MSLKVYCFSIKLMDPLNGSVGRGSKFRHHGLTITLFPNGTLAAIIQGFDENSLRVRFLHNVLYICCLLNKTYDPLTLEIKNITHPKNCNRRLA